MTSASDTPTMSGRGQTLMWIIPLFAAVIWAVYEVPATGRTGQTLGKRILGIKVLPMEGDHQLGGRRSFRRWLPLGIPLAALGACFIGVIFLFFDCLRPTYNRPLKLSWHDMYAATIVVNVAKPADGAGPDGASRDEEKTSIGGTS
jgi:uncharacterized RDD family membrane protein YckC